MSIEAMKQAIEALKKSEPSDDSPSKWLEHYAAIVALEQAIKQAEKQEPVAWISKDDAEDLRRGGSLTVMLDPNGGDIDDVALYAAPPQREWVGLTDEEILEIDKGLDARSYSLFAYTRAIEAKLKEKNHVD